MPLRTKYEPVLKLMQELKVTEINVWEERGQLVIEGIAKNSRDRDLILHRISQINRNESTDVKPEITIAEE